PPRRRRKPRGGNMGFYDCRCLLTGVSLKGAEAVLVPLLEPNGHWRPISPAVKGKYDRLGCIDGIANDGGHAAILAAVAEAVAAGSLVIADWHEYQTFRRNPHPLEAHLHAFERNLNDDPRTAVLAGRPPAYALFCRAVWDAVAVAAAAPVE